MQNHGLPEGARAHVAAAGAAGAHGPRLVVLGFDGVDPRRVGELARRGMLPNLLGLLVSNQPVAVRDPGLADVAVTAYRFLGIEPPRDLVGRAWFAESHGLAAPSLDNLGESRQGAGLGAGGAATAEERRDGARRR